MYASEVFVGIDVAKAQLGVAPRPGGERFSAENRGGGITALVERLQGLEPSLIILEATGGLEQPLPAALAEQGLPVVVVNARQIHDFAKAMGRLAEIGCIDAQVLAEFAERVRPQVCDLPDVRALTLEKLLARRRQVVEMMTATRNRLHAPHDAVPYVLTSNRTPLTCRDIRFGLRHPWSETKRTASTESSWRSCKPIRTGSVRLSR